LFEIRKTLRPLVPNDKRLGFRVVVADLPEHTQRKIAAEITFGDRGSVGIRFPESIRHGEFDPPIPLSNLHRRLERLWLQSREK
jgi:hypothetical protein